MRQRVGVRIAWLRIVVAVAIGAAFAMLTIALLRSRGPLSSVEAGDFTYPLDAARALLRGEDPYLAVRAMRRPFSPTLYYPLPAALAALPFAPLSSRGAAAAFVGIGAALLAVVLTREGNWWRLLAFASGPAIATAFSVQWAPLLIAASSFAPTLGLVAAKPNLALALFGQQTTLRSIWWGITGGATLCLISLLIVPSWPLEWLATFRHPLTAQYRLPIMTGYGAVLALAGLRWRRPEARLLLAMACTPQNGFGYDAFPVLLVAQSRFEAMTLALLSAIGYVATTLIPLPLRSTSTTISDLYYPFVIGALYLPALVLVLRRPNRAPDEGDAR